MRANHHVQNTQSVVNLSFLAGSKMPSLILGSAVQTKVGSEHIQSNWLLTLAKVIPGMEAADCRG